MAAAEYQWNDISAALEVKTLSLMVLSRVGMLGVDD